MSAEGVRAPLGSRYTDQRPYVVVADLADCESRRQVAPDSAGG